MVCTCRGKGDIGNEDAELLEDVDETVDEREERCVYLKYI